MPPLHLESTFLRFITAGEGTPNRPAEAAP